MKAAFLRRSASAFAIGIVTVLSSSCAVPVDGGYGSGYDNNVSVGIGLDYYEPWGTDYGGWGPGYRVGPYRDGGHYRGAGGRPGPREYRPVSAGRAMPSIPSRARSGGSGGGRRSH